MAKKNRYRWQNEKKHARAMAEMKQRNQARMMQSKTLREDWGSMLQMYELVSMHPLCYRKVS